MFRFSAKAVHIVSHYMAHADIRYYLNGIYAEPAPGGGAFLVATDGHQMGVFYDAEALCKESVLFRLTKDGIAACKPKRLYSQQFLEINPITERLTVMGSLGVFYGVGARRKQAYSMPVDEIYIQPGKCFVEGKFPDWKRVMKPFMVGKKAETVTVNARYMAKFFTATKHHCGGNFSSVSMFFKSESDAILLANGLIPEFQVLLMPMRESNAKRMHPKVIETLEIYQAKEPA